MSNDIGQIIGLLFVKSCDNEISVDDNVLEEIRRLCETYRLCLEKKEVPKGINPIIFNNILNSKKNKNLSQFWRFKGEKCKWVFWESGEEKHVIENKEFSFGDIIQFGAERGFGMHIVSDVTKFKLKDIQQYDEYGNIPISISKYIFDPFEFYKEPWYSENISIQIDPSIKSHFESVKKMGEMGDVSKKFLNLLKKSKNKIFEIYPWGGYDDGGDGGSWQDHSYEENDSSSED